MPEESQIESYEHQDNANIRHQSFPELVSEEQEIYTDYDGGHRHHVKHYSYLPAHFCQHSPHELQIGADNNVFLMPVEAVDAPE